MVWTRAGAKARKKPSPSASQSQALKRRPAETEPDVELELSEPAMEPRTPAPASTTPGTLSPDPVSVRSILAGTPTLLEEGLALLREKGKPVGMDYPTDVGSIDLLMRDRGGALVVVMVAKSTDGSDVVADILQRIGWVRKHVAKTREVVRGIVVMEREPENLSYAAAAVADTVSFKTYWMQLSFDEIEL